MEGLQCPIDKEDLGEPAGLHVKCLLHALTVLGCQDCGSFMGP